MEDNYQPTIDNRLDSLDGDVCSQIKVEHRAWLDMGAEDWGKTPDVIKAAAFQIATTLKGWGESSLKDMMVEKYDHLSDATMEFTIKLLKDLSQKHPFEIEKEEKE